MNAIEVFVQGPDLPEIFVLNAEAGETVAAVIARIDHAAVREVGLLIFVEEFHAPVEAEAIVDDLVQIHAPAEGDIRALKLHVSRHRHVDVHARFNGQVRSHRFHPSATIGRVHHWAAIDAFGMTPRDAAEHVLQIEGVGNQRPDVDTHVGSLVKGGACAITFDLVPRKRVEG
jgi:hypothetical protein